MLKILIDFRMHKASGIGTYIRNLTPYLVSEFDVVLLGKNEEIKQYDFYCTVEVIEFESGIYSVKEQFEFFKKIPACDVFWSPHYNVPIFSVAAKYRVVTIHDVFHLAHSQSLSLRKKIYANFVINKAISLSDIVLTVSEFSKNEIQKYVKTDKIIDIVRNSINREHFIVVRDESRREGVKTKYSLPEDFVLFVGNVKPNKNLVNLLLAVKENPDVKLVVVGRTDGFITADSGPFSFLKNDEDLRARVFFTGYVDDMDIPVFYSLATLFVFPSLYEGFGIPPLEAQACGCPVIASNIESLVEVCMDSVLYFDPTNANDIANKIRLLLSDKNLRESLQEKGFKNIERFSWKRESVKLVEIFKALSSK